MALNPRLLEILVCPENKTSVRLAEPEIIAALNKQVAAGSLKNRDGDLVREPLEGGLIREDGQYLYPIRQDIPVMVIAEGIPLSHTK